MDIFVICVASIPAIVVLLVVGFYSPYITPEWVCSIDNPNQKIVNNGKIITYDECIKLAPSGIQQIESWYIIGSIIYLTVIFILFIINDYLNREEKINKRTPI